MMTYLAINTVPLARDYGFVVNAYSELIVKSEFMFPSVMRGMRKHFVLLKIDRSLARCQKDFGGFVVDVSGNIKHRRAFINLESVGLSSDSLSIAKDVKKEIFVPLNDGEEILLTASDITQVF